MDLDEMQATWSEMSDQLEKQKKLTDKLIMEMTQERYKSKLSKIKAYETGGAVICFVMVLFILINFNKLDTWYLIVLGLIVIDFLIILPVLTLYTIQKMSSIDVLKNDIKQTMSAFAKARKRFLLVQKLGIGASFVLMLTIIPVLSKITKNKDIFIMKNEISLWYMGILLVFLIAFALWGYGCYKNITTSAGNLLKELESEE